MHITSPFFLPLLTFLAILPGVLSNRRWHRKPHLPVLEPSLEAASSDTNPVAIPASPRTGKPRKGPYDLKKIHDFPTFHINAQDDEHGAMIFGEGGGCMRNTMASITGVPKAVMESEYRKGVAQGGNADGAQGAWGKPGQVEGNLMWDPDADDGFGNRREDWQPSVAEEVADTVLKSGMIGYAYDNSIVPGEGKTSACIQIDILGQGAEHVQLWRRSVKVPRTMAAMWHSENCEGEPDMWVNTRLGDDQICMTAPNKQKGLWRSMRVWYGSERLKEEQFGEGSISLTQELALWRGGR